MAGFTILGGEPMEEENQAEPLPFLERIKRELPGKDIWIYSGYTWEELTKRHSKTTDRILALTDILIDGEFVEAQKDLKLRFRGSANQRIIDVQRSLETGSVVISGYQET